jgi:predicted nucleotidyltransferase
MKPSQALQLYREQIRSAVGRCRVSNPRVFGSVLHGGDGEGSDLDLLVDPMPGATLLDLGGLQADLEDILGIPVDVLTPDDIPLKFRTQVLLEAEAL